MLTPQFVFNLAAKLVILLFAASGGSCTGIEQALGRHVNITIHDRIGSQGFGGPGLQAMPTNLKVCKEINRSSSPNQMGVSLARLYRRRANARMRT